MLEVEIKSRFHIVNEIFSFPLHVSWRHFEISRVYQDGPRSTRAAEIPGATINWSFLHNRQNQEVLFISPIMNARFFQCYSQVEGTHSWFFFNVTWLIHEDLRSLISTALSPMSCRNLCTNDPRTFACRCIPEDKQKLPSTQERKWLTSVNQVMHF